MQSSRSGVAGQFQGTPDYRVFGGRHGLFAVDQRALQVMEQRAGKHERPLQHHGDLSSQQQRVQAAISAPCCRIRPAVGSSRRLISRIRELLPPPEGPTMAVIRPLAAENVTLPKMTAFSPCRSGRIRPIPSTCTVGRSSGGIFSAITYTAPFHVPHLGRRWRPTPFNYKTGMPINPKTKPLFLTSSCKKQYTDACPGGFGSIGTVKPPLTMPGNHDILPIFIRVVPCAVAAGWSGSARMHQAGLLFVLFFCAFMAIFTLLNTYSGMRLI